MRRLLIATATVVVLAAGYAVADAEDVVPGVLTLAPAARATGGSTTPSPSDAAWPVTRPLTDVLATTSTSAPTPTRTGLARALRSAVQALGPAVSAQVVDVATGAELYGRKAATARTPASTTKLLTAASVLAGLGPDATLSTRVLQGSSPARIVLVGGGDTRLSGGQGQADEVFGRAGLGDLAAATAMALTTAGRTSVSLGLDDSLFTGPRLNPHWVPSDSAQGEVGPVTAIGLQSKAPMPGRAAPADPSMTAAAAFAQALRAAGIRVSRKVSRVKAGSGATQLAAVQSAPISELLAVTLATSDNTEAEVLARLAAHAAGHAASFTGAAAQNVRAVRALGVPTGGIRLYDGSGLARADLIPPRTLTTLLAKAATSKQPGLRAMFAGLPVAGFTGTLAPRYQTKAESAGAGVVRAKTGTLSGVSSLAGIAVDRDGRLLAFAFMAEHLTSGAAPARAQLDRAATAMARCGCR